MHNEVSQNVKDSLVNDRRRRDFGLKLVACVKEDLDLDLTWIIVNVDV